MCLLSSGNIKRVFIQEMNIRLKKHSTCIVNLDSLGKQGTHWVCCMPSNFKENELWYFDSLGILYQHEFEKSAQKEKVNVIFNTAQYQNLLSVLCG